MNKKKSKILLIISFVLLVFVLLTLFYFYWPIIRDRYVVIPQTIEKPNINAYKVTEKEKINYLDQRRIIIPALGINAALILPEENYSGDKNDFVESNLDSGVVMFPNGITDLKNENLVFFGHSSSIHPLAEYAVVFVNLDRLALGDEIFLINDKSQQIKYVVNKEPEIVNSAATEIVASDKEKGMITLITCWPPGTTNKRIYTTGKLVE